MWHSCGTFRLADHFAGKPPILRKTFTTFVSVARSNGPVIVYAQKTRIVIQARVRFAGAVVRSSWLDASELTSALICFSCSIHGARRLATSGNSAASGRLGGELPTQRRCQSHSAP